MIIVQCKMNLIGENFFQNLEMCGKKKGFLGGGSEGELIFFCYCVNLLTV